MRLRWTTDDIPGGLQLLGGKGRSTATPRWTRQELGPPNQLVTLQGVRWPVTGLR
jgi:hypothetical protein